MCRSFETGGVLATVVVSAVSLVAYVACGCWGVPGGDGGELCIAAAHWPRVAMHPPGYPLATFLGAVGAEAVRHLNQTFSFETAAEPSLPLQRPLPLCFGTTVAVSCVPQALANAVTFRLVSDWIQDGLSKRSKEPSVLLQNSAALVAVAVGGFNPTAVRYATSAEVFSLNTLFCMTLLYSTWCFTKEVARGRDGFAAAVRAAVCMGLGAANQHTMLLLVFPCLCWATFLARGWNIRVLITCMLLCAITAAIPYTLLRQPTNTSHHHSWAADLEDLASLLRHFLRQEYGTFKLAPVLYEMDEGHVISQDASQVSDIGSQSLQRSVSVVVNGLLGALCQIGLTLSGADVKGHLRAVAYFGAFVEVLDDIVSPFVSWRAIIYGVFVCSSACAVRFLAGCEPVPFPNPGFAFVLLFSLVVYLCVFCCLANLPVDSPIMKHSIVERFWLQPLQCAVLLGVAGLFCCANVVSRCFVAATSEAVGHLWERAVAPLLLLGFATHVIWNGFGHAGCHHSEGGYFIQDYYHSVLVGIPQNATLLVSGDLPTTSLRYLQSTGIRPDVAVLNRELLASRHSPLLARRWQAEYGPTLKFPNRPHGGDPIKFARMNLGTSDGSTSRPLLFLDIFRGKNGFMEKGAWRLKEFEFWPRGACIEVQRSSVSKSGHHHAVFDAWFQGKHGKMSLTPLPHSATAPMRRQMTWRKGSWELWLLWSWWGERETLLVHAVRYALDRDKYRRALQAAASLGKEFKYEAEARAVGLSALFLRSYGSALSGLGLQKDSVTVWSEYVEAVERYKDVDEKKIMHEMAPAVCTALGQTVDSNRANSLAKLCSRLDGQQNLNRKMNRTAPGPSGDSIAAVLHLMHVATGLAGPRGVGMLLRGLRRRVSFSRPSAQVGTSLPVVTQELLRISAITWIREADLHDGKKVQTNSNGRRRF